MKIESRSFVFESVSQFFATVSFYLLLYIITFLLCTCVCVWGVCVCVCVWVGGWVGVCVGGWVGGVCVYMCGCGMSGTYTIVIILWF